MAVLQSVVYFSGSTGFGYALLKLISLGESTYLKVKNKKCNNSKCGNIILSDNICWSLPFGKLQGWLTCTVYTAACNRCHYISCRYVMDSHHHHHVQEGLGLM